MQACFYHTVVGVLSLHLNNAADRTLPGGRALQPVEGCQELFAGLAALASLAVVSLQRSLPADEAALLAPLLDLTLHTLMRRLAFPVGAKGVLKRFGDGPAEQALAILGVVFRPELWRVCMFVVCQCVSVSGLQAVQAVGLILHALPR